MPIEFLPQSLKKALYKLVKSSLNQVGVDVIRYETPSPCLPQDFDDSIIDVIQKVQPFTQTSVERLSALCEAVKYVVASKIPGDIVECGVWKGGSMMAVAHTLLLLKDHSRHLHLFDTFEGMTTPSEKDVSLHGDVASELLKTHQKEDQDSAWCCASLDAVKAAIDSVGYDLEKIHFIQGKVEDTIPEQAPAVISLLRLDTDWYESTRHELIHLFPRLSPGGVIIIDDYGHWKGARRAVDEYIQAQEVKILLNRIDYTGRIGVVWANS